MDTSAHELELEFISPLSLALPITVELSVLAGLETEFDQDVLPIFPNKAFSVYCRVVVLS